MTDALLDATTGLVVEDDELDGVGQPKHPLYLKRGEPLLAYKPIAAAA